MGGHLLFPFSNYKVKFRAPAELEMHPIMVPIPLSFPSNLQVVGYLTGDSQLDTISLLLVFF
jgi:hypothetical protein